MGLVREIAEHSDAPSRPVDEIPSWILTGGSPASSEIPHHEYLLYRSGLRRRHNYGDHRAALPGGDRHGRRHECGPHRRLEFGQTAGLRAGAGEIVRAVRGRNLTFSTDVAGGIRGADMIFVASILPRRTTALARAGRPISATLNPWPGPLQSMPTGRKSSWKVDHPGEDRGVDPGDSGGQCARVPLSSAVQSGVSR